MKQKTIRKIIIMLLFVFVMPLFGVLSQVLNADEISRRTPKQLVTGIYEDSDTTFNYYKLNDGTYGISLTEAGLSQGGKITLPETHKSKNVTAIMAGGFKNCSATQILFPNSHITTIDYEAFFCSHITKIVLPYTLSAIGDSAFYGCNNLTSVTFTNSSKTSDACSVSDDEGVEYSELSKIPDFCFFKCNKLSELNLPYKIAEIGYEAFYGCVNLNTSIYFSSYLKTIRSRAFQSCVNLKEIYIPTAFFTSTDTDIEAHAFNNCSSDLKFYFSGIKTNIAAWETKHPNWGLYSDINASKYEYKVNAGDIAVESDWQYQTIDGKVTILNYLGDSNNVQVLSIPTNLPAGSNNLVTEISQDALNSIKSSLVRLYLPYSLERINNLYFQNFTYLKYIGVNSDCDTSTDVSNPSIDLSQITGLKYIGTRAFCYLPKRSSIVSIKLPYSLIAVGDFAFGQDGTDNNFLYVKEFTWDYKEGVSALEVVGHDAFYKMGLCASKKGYNGSNNIVYDKEYYNHYLQSDGTKNYSLTTLVFPKTFKSFGLNDADRTKYGFSTPDTNKYERPAHVFAGCPLLEKVFFRGDSSSPDLFLGLQIFCLNESLKTIVFEERPGKSITFQTQNGNWAQPSIGSNAGSNYNDFYADPFLQTLVLPNTSTTLRIQKMAFQGNARACMYLTSTMGNNMVGNEEQAPMDFFKKTTRSDTTLKSMTLWNKIGDESYFNSTNNKGYHGYAFASNVADNNTFRQEAVYGIDQNMPYYENIHYKETINNDHILNEQGVASLDIEVGASTNDELVMQDKCAFVLDKTNTKAIMSKYLYDRRDASFSGTAVIPPSINFNNKSYPVTEIGDSAFSAAFCDNQHDQDQANYPSSYKDLSKVYLPDTITRIGEYAFMRAYGVNEVSTYTTYNGSSTTIATGNEYVMPSALRTIGRHAFSFCNIKQFRKIPYSCLLDENTHSTTYQTSVFSNNLSLRKITFRSSDLANSAESTSSKYYQTTIYQTSSTDPTSSSNMNYTCSLYSNDLVSYNKNALLILLNRDLGDYDVDNIGESDYKSGTFKGLYKSGEALYGAYRMGFFIKTLAIGSYKTDGNGNLLNQALFSAVCNKTNNAAEPTDSYIYLYKPIQNYNDNYYDLTAMSFSSGATLSLPENMFNGCESLQAIEFPKLNEDDKVSIPAGLFANISTASLKFRTPDSKGVMHDMENGVLDLTYTGLVGIGDEAFKNVSGITKVITPILESHTFTIGTSAFYGCTNLEELDSHTTTTEMNISSEAFKGCSKLSTLSFASSDLSLGKSCFEDCAITSITWPSDSSAKVAICSAAFKNNPLTTLTLHPGTTSLEGSAFENCTSLSSVTASGDLPKLTSLGSSSFKNCTALNNFDFNKFTALTKIGSSSFTANSATNGHTICPGGIINLPQSIKSIEDKAFQYTNVTQININSSSIKLGSNCMANCPSLTKVEFTNLDCQFSSNDKSDYFSEDPNLVSVILPTGFDVVNYMPSLFKNSSHAKIYTYKKNTEVTNIPTSAKIWREFADGQALPLYYYAETSSDLLNANGGLLDKANGLYWTIKNGVFYELGRPISDPQNGVVTFSSGHTLDDSGNLT